MLSHALHCQVAKLATVEQTVSNVPPKLEIQYTLKKKSQTSPKHEKQSKVKKKKKNEYKNEIERDYEYKRAKFTESKNNESILL